MRQKGLYKRVVTLHDNCVQKAKQAIYIMLLSAGNDNQQDVVLIAEKNHERYLSTISLKLSLCGDIRIFGVCFLLAECCLFSSARTLLTISFKRSAEHTLFLSLQALPSICESLLICILVFISLRFLAVDNRFLIGNG